MFRLNRAAWFATSLLSALAVILPMFGPAKLMGDDEIPIADIEREEPVDFEKEILPIFRRNCLACHSSTKAESDLVLENPDAILQGGFEGPGIDLDDPEESLILQLAARQRESFMPPDGNDVGAKNLTPDELGLIKLWIAQGGKGAVSGSLSEIQWQPLPPGVNPIYAVSVTQDGQFVAASRANQIFLYHLPSRRSLGRLTDPSLLETGVYTQPGVADLDLIQSLAFSPDGNRLVSGGFRTAKIWRKEPAVALQEIADLEGKAQVLAVSQDGSWGALGTEEGKIAVVEIESGKVTAAFQGHTDVVTGLAFSPDAETLYSCSADQAWKIWKRDGSEVATVGTETSLQALAVVDDGKRLALGGEDHRIYLWNLSSEEEEPSDEPSVTLEGHGGPVTCLAALADGEFLSAGLDGTVRRWNSREGTQVREINHEGPVTAIAVQADGSRFASASPEHHSIKIWNLADGNLLHELRGDHRVKFQEEADIRQESLAKRLIDLANADLKEASDRKAAEEENVAKAEEERTKAEAELAEKAKEADAQLAEKEAAEKDAEEAKVALAAMEEMKKKTEESLVAARQAAEQAEAERKRAEEALAKAAGQASEMAAKAAELETQEKKIAEELAATMKRLADSEEKAKGLAEPVQKAVEAKTAAERAAETAQRAAERAQMTLQRVGEEIPPLEQAVTQRTEEHQESESRLATTREKLAESEIAYRRVAFADDQATLAAVGEDGVIRIFDVDSGTPLNQFPSGSEGAVPVAFLPHGGLLTVGSEGGGRVWSVEPRWELERTLGSPDSTEVFVDRVTALDISPDSKILATGTGEPSRSGELALWDLESGELLHRLPDAHSDTVFAVDFSRDGQRIVSSAADRFVKIFRVEDGEFERAFEGHTHHVLGVAWSADGRLLSSGGADNVVKIWNARTGDQNRTIPGFGKEVTAVRFLGDSDQVIASSGDATLQLKRSDNGGNVRNFSGASDFLYCVEVTADGNTIIAGGQDSILRVWAQDGTVIAEFGTPESE